MIYVLRHCNHVGLLLNMALAICCNKSGSFRENTERMKTR